MVPIPGGTSGHALGVAMLVLLFGLRPAFLAYSLVLLLQKFAGADIGTRPLLLVAVLALIAGVQLFCFGLLAELQMRTYHESQGRPIYRVRETLRGGLAVG